MTDDHVAALRALMLGDHEEYERLCDARERLDSQPEYLTFFGAAFLEAVRQRFGRSWSNGDVIRFVASVRGRYRKRAVEIDPRSAELLIKATLGARTVADLGDSVKTTQVWLLPDLVSELSSKQLDHLLVLARLRAQRHIE